MAKKPRPDFPLFPHASGRWAKKVRSQFRYFGKVADDPHGEQALLLWLDQKDDLLAGRSPQHHSAAITVEYLLNRFLTAKRCMLDSGELGALSFANYYATSVIVGSTLGHSTPVVGLGPADFERLRRAFANNRGLVAVGGHVGRARGIFKFAVDEGLIPQLPRYGQSFRKPDAASIRRQRLARGPRIFTPAELRSIVAAAGCPLKAMVLLAANCGFGQSDLANLPMHVLDLDHAWITYPRPKTGVHRRCPLWPETVEAVREALLARPRPKSPQHADLALLNSRGGKWVTVTHRTLQVGEKTVERVVASDHISRNFRALLTRLHIEHRSFYCLRRGFQTIGEESGDLPAVRAIMGHVASASDMASVYRQYISDERLTAVTNCVRAWLWPNKSVSDCLKHDDYMI